MQNVYLHYSHQLNYLKLILNFCMRTYYYLLLNCVFVFEDLHASIDDLMVGN